MHALPALKEAVQLAKASSGRKDENRYFSPVSSLASAMRAVVAWLEVCGDDECWRRRFEVLCKEYNIPMRVTLFTPKVDGEPTVIVIDRAQRGRFDQGERIGPLPKGVVLLFVHPRTRAYLRQGDETVMADATSCSMGCTLYVSGACSEYLAVFIPKRERQKIKGDRRLGVLGRL